LKYDLIIRGGSVVDGSGKPAVRADVAVNGDRIAAIGLLADATADREIDATGMVVSPGFVDLHTHLDAQVGWDPYMTSSSWHGVTTVLMGNCGVTFAPVVEQDRAFLAEMMESVEDIPRQAILDGLPWDWETSGLGATPSSGVERGRTGGPLRDSHPGDGRAFARRRRSHARRTRTHG
jgi:N-acyl-D-aspartate/D-glutamate deacylase